MGHSRRAVAGALAAALALSATPAAAVPGDALPPVDSAYAPYVRAARVTAAGYAVELADPWGGSVVVAGRWDGPRRELPDRWLLDLAGDRLDVRPAEFGPTAEVTSVDLATGTTTVTPVAGRYLASLDEGFVVHTADELRVVRPDGTSRRLGPGLPRFACACDSDGPGVHDFALDEAGALYALRTTTGDRVEHLDFATGTTTVVAATRAGGLALNPGWLAWSEPGRVVRRPRAGGAATAIADPGPSLLAVTDTAWAWRSGDAVLTAAAGSTRPLSSVAGADPYRPDGVLTDGTSFYAPLGELATDAGLYRFAAGDSAGVLVVPFRTRPARVEDLTADAGQVAYADDSGVPSRVWSHPSAPEGVGPRAAVPGSRPGDELVGVSGDVAVLRRGDRTLVYDGAALLADLGHASAGPPSGHQVPVHDGVLRLLQEPASVPLPAVHVSRLWGRYAYGVRSRTVSGSTEHQPVRFDLDAPPGTAPVEIAGWRGSNGTLFAWGDWAVWGSFGGAAPDGAVARDLASGATVPVPAGMRVEAVGDGVLIGVRDRDLVAVDLTAAGLPETVLGTWPDAYPLVEAAVWARTAVWHGPDRRLHRRALDAVAPPAPARLLDVAAAAAFSPDADGRDETWRFRATASAPVARWTLTLTTETGAPVRTFTGTAPRGGVAADWLGRDDGHAPVPPGTYRWRLVADALTREGTVALTYGVPVATVRTAPVVTGATYWGHPLHVGLGGPAAGYDLLASRRLRRADGTWYDEPWRVEAAGTTLTPRTVKVHPPGTTRYAVRGVGHDGRRGPLSVPVSVTAPLDDRYAGLRWAPAPWAREHRDRAYASTLSATTTLGAKVALTAEARGFGLVAGRCPDCGRVEVRVDGRVVAVVDTYARTFEPSRLVWLGAVSGPTRPRLLELRSVGPRRRVLVDALAAVR